MMNSSDFNGMDTKIERKKRFPFQVVLGSVLGCIGLLWMVFRDTSSSMNIGGHNFDATSLYFAQGFFP